MKKHTVLWIILTAAVVFGAAAAAVLLAHSGEDQKPAEATLPAVTSAATSAVTDGESEADQPQITVALSEYRVLLNWTAVEGADGYTITYDDGSGPVDYGKTNRASFRKKGLKGGTAYTFYVTPYQVVEDQEIPMDTQLAVSGHTLPDIPVYTAERDGDTCRLSWKEVNNAAEYRVFSSEDGESWTQVGATSGLEYTFTIGDNQKFTGVKAVIRTEAGEIVSDYTKTLIPDGAKKKKLCSYGDSVAVGIGSHNYSYADIFAEEHGLELIDRSNAGSELSSNNPKKHHIAESILKDVTPDYDYVFIEGGNNDHYFNSPLGELSPEGTTEFDMKTTVGALEAAFTYLRDACPDTKVVFIMVHKRAPMKNELGKSFEEYAEAIGAVCERYAVPVADCLNDSGFDTADAEICNEYTHHFNGVFPTGDGVHPTEAAYRKYYLPLIEAALNEE